MDEIIRACSEDGYVNMSAVTARTAAERARVIHNTTPVATAALGRTLCAASMLGRALKKDGASVTVRINGGGPLGGILAVGDNLGNMRGYVQNPLVSIEKRPDGKLNVGGAVGKDGMLTVIRDFGSGDPYSGSITLVSGEIAEDVTKYLTESDQVGSACGLGVLVDTDLSVLAAGGYIVQLMPGAGREHIEALEENIKRAGQVTEILRGAGAGTLVEKVLDGLGPRILERAPVAYRCYCSRERVRNAVMSIGEAELRDIERSDEETTVSCQFCDNIYSFSPAEIREMLEFKEQNEETQK